MRTCPKCGAQVARDVAVCPVCGAALGASADERLEKLYSDLVKERDALDAPSAAPAPAAPAAGTPSAEKPAEKGEAPAEEQGKKGKASKKKDKTGKKTSARRKDKKEAESAVEVDPFVRVSAEFRTARFLRQSKAGKESGPKIARMIAMLVLTLGSLAAAVFLGASLSASVPVRGADPLFALFKGKLPAFFSDARGRFLAVWAAGKTKRLAFSVAKYASAAMIGSLLVSLIALIFSWRYRPAVRGFAVTFLVIALLASMTEIAALAVLVKPAFKPFPYGPFAAFGVLFVAVLTVGIAYYRPKKKKDSESGKGSGKNGKK